MTTRHSSYTLLFVAAVDFLFFLLLRFIGLHMLSAQASSFAVSFAVFILLKKFFLPSEAKELTLVGSANCWTVWLLALLLRSSLVTLLVMTHAWRPTVAIVPAIAVTFLMIYFGTSRHRRLFSSISEDSERALREIAIGMIAFTLILRIAYSGQIELMPEEAYYWNYAQHINIGYLDHPPMVAWMIRLTTAILGSSELAVRLGAILCWAVTAFFCYRLTWNLFNKATAFRAIMLLTALPFFFFVGMLMMPDAPLTASWAAALFFLERALVAGRKRAWWGLGVAMGIGMLSKYTISLLAPAALLFMLIDRRSRHWFTRPEPYLATVVGLILFTPVIVWNADNHWASFIFQGPRRFTGSIHFGLPMLIGSIMLLLTPAGAISALTCFCPSTSAAAGKPEQQRRVKYFMATMIIAPLSVLIIFSLIHNPKLNWSGPIWLAVIPGVAWQLRQRNTYSAFDAILLKIWKCTFPATFAFFGFGLLFLTVGVPGHGYPPHTHLLGWRDLASKVERIEDEYEKNSSKEMIVVGIDKYFITSEISYYRNVADEGNRDSDPVDDTTGCHLFGQNSLMYSFWVPPQAVEGKTVLLVDDDSNDIREQCIAEHFDSLGPVKKIITRKRGKITNIYYYRIGYGYRTSPASQNCVAD